MAPRGPSRPGITRLQLLPLLLAAALAAGGCGGDDPKPVTPRDPRLVMVITTDELLQALADAVPGDTIEVRAEFSTAKFELPGGITFGPATSPIHLIGVARAAYRPEIVFADTTAAGFTFAGHDGSSVVDLDFRGGLDAIRISGSDMTLSGLNIREVRRDGISVDGAGSSGTIVGCFIEAPRRHGILAAEGSVSVERNTIVDAGDTGIRLFGQASATANNVYRARLGGIYAGSAGVGTISCNDAFATAPGPDYASDPAGLISEVTNFALDPEFCAGAWTIAATSPLAPLNSGGCGLIGAFPVTCDVPGGSAPRTFGRP